MPGKRSSPEASMRATFVRISSRTPLAANPALPKSLDSSSPSVLGNLSVVFVSFIFSQLYKDSHGRTKLRRDETQGKGCGSAESQPEGGASSDQRMLSRSKKRNGTNADLPQPPSPSWSRRSRPSATVTQ